MSLADRLPAQTRTARFWTIAIFIWFLLLCFLSHGDHGVKPPDLGIPQLDKVAHFGYFFGGGGLLAAALFFRKNRFTWTRIILTTVGILALVGIFDEWHQSFFANRTGNDPLDWAADVLGALCGSLVFKKCHRIFG